MPGSNSQWPESYGFSIVGDGPCYVIHVDRGSIAFGAGISPGDQLLELDGHNVTDMSSDAIKTLALHSNTSPPTLGVVSRVTYLHILANQRWGYGFQAAGAKPTVVESVDPPGPAYEAGLRPGDFILEINGKEIRSFSSLLNRLETRHGKMTLTVIPRNSRLSSASVETGGNKIEERKPGRVRRARDLFARMNLVLGADYEQKMTVLRLLRQYADDRNVQKFTSSLNLVLKTAQDRRLLSDLRPFIPVKQQAKFDRITNHTPQGDVSALSVNTASLPSKASRVQHGGTGGGLLAVATEKSRIKHAVVERDDGSFGFVLRGSAPVHIESVLLGGPAANSGLHAGDRILKVNGIDVSACGHSHLVKILQASGDTPRLEVQQRAVSTPQLHTDDDLTNGHHHNFSNTLSSHTSHKSDSSWLSGSNVTLDGRSFREKVHELLNHSDKMALRAALIEFNMTRNIAQLVDDGNSILDTPAKRSLWVFLLPRMSTEQQSYVFKYVDISRKHMQDVINKASRSLKENSVRSVTFSPNYSVVSPDISDTLRSKSVDGADNPRYSSFTTQLEYLLTSRERSQLKHALEIYADKRNLQYLMADLSDILDTPSKKTLWQYMVPLLSSSHQRIVQSTLGLPEWVLPDSMQGHQGARNGLRSPTKTTGGVLPKYGDILMLQNEFVGNFLRSRHRHSLDTDDDTDDMEPRYAASSSTSSQGIRHSPSVDSSIDNRYNPRHFEPRRRHFSQFQTPGKKGPGASSDVEQSTMTINPIYAESSSPAKDARPKTQMVRESVTQTTPTPSPGLSAVIPGLGGIPRSHSTPGATKGGDYRTIVSVYDQQRNPEISYTQRQAGSRHEKLDTIKETGRSEEDLLDAGAANGTYEEPVSTSSNPPYTNIDDVALQESQNLEPFYHTLDSPKNSPRYYSPKKTPPWKKKKSGTGSASGSRSNSPSVKGVVTDMPSTSPSISALKARLYESNPQQTHFARVNKTLSAQSGVPKKLTLYGKSPTSSSQTSPHSPRSPTSPREHRDTTGNGSEHSLEPAVSESARSLSDSYHTKAMNAIKTLDEAVANEHSASSDQDPTAVGSHVTALPAVPIAPPLPPPGTPPTSHKMNVKRMNWEKISRPNDRTVWAKIDHRGDDLEDIVKYLELEQQFSTKKNKVSESFRDRKNENYILNPKKAYNISILLGHLKLPEGKMKTALLEVDESLLTIELLKQVLAYSPDAKELEEYNNYTGSPDELSKPDQFMYELSRVPGYGMRLKSILFKANFDEKVDELKQNLNKLKKAARELQSSEKLAKVLELVLAMGNYMNKGSVRVGQAAGFRVSFLQQLELTKTSDGKASFLHVLADAVKTKCPDILSFAEELPTVSQATRVSSDAMQHEIAELKRVVEEISSMVRRVGGENTRVAVNDRFHSVMHMFIASASDKMTSLMNLHKQTVHEIQEMAVYFGENRNYKSPEDIFKIFADFIAKFEKAHNQNLIMKRPERGLRQSAGPSNNNVFKKKVSTLTERFENKR